MIAYEVTLTIGKDESGAYIFMITVIDNILKREVIHWKLAYTKEYIDLLHKYLCIYLSESTSSKMNYKYPKYLDNPIPKTYFFKYEEKDVKKLADLIYKDALKSFLAYGVDTC